MIKAFNLAEEYRCPVFFMMDEVVGHMTERVVIPPADQIEVVERKWTTKQPGEFRLYATTATDLVPEMIKAGDGYRVHVTGLTHDERGYPAMNPQAQDALVRRLKDKITKNGEKLVDVRLDGVEGADVVVLSYGITSRIVTAAVEEARKRGVKVGHLRLVICWPFPATLVREIASKAKAIVFPELNLGQMVLEAERAVAGKIPVISVPHAGGTVHDPNVIVEKIMEAER
jgi:2-oxoglutarate ferredoxin oxidoreductase subunit alpha